MIYRDDVLNMLERRIKECVGDRKVLAFVYGSSVHEATIKTTSDVDVMILAKWTDQALMDSAVKVVMDAHERFGLSLDFAIPYQVKVCMNAEECAAALRGEGFVDEAGQPAILFCENKTYLASREMKLRLVATALATKKRILIGNPKEADVYQRAAWKTLRSVIRQTQSFDHSSMTDECRAFQSGLVKAASGYLSRTYKEYIGFPLTADFTDFITEQLSYLSGGSDNAEVEALLKQYE